MTTPSRRLLVSFSGGETSALMTKLCHERLGDQYDEILTVFSNTGQENEATLEFVDRCDRKWGWNVVWIETVMSEEKGVGARARVVDFATASRNGEPFEDVIRKHGIPNSSFPHCTREMKERPIRAYAKSIGWKTGSYDTAIGIRIDEIDRMNHKAKALHLVYPMVNPFPHRKLDVNAFWDAQDFRLTLKGYQGNCRSCWKKSYRKLLTIMSEDPESFDFFERMESTYPMAGPNPKQEEKRFFRGKLKVEDLRRMAAEGNFAPAADDSRVYPTDTLEGLELDLAGGCSESCEVEFEVDDDVQEAA
jgi:hypothetical protein